MHSHRHLADCSHHTFAARFLLRASMPPGGHTRQIAAKTELKTKSRFKSRPGGCSIALTCALKHGLARPLDLERWLTRPSMKRMHHGQSLPAACPCTDLLSCAKEGHKRTQALRSTAVASLRTCLRAVMSQGDFIDAIGRGPDDPTLLRNVHHLQLLQI